MIKFDASGFDFSGKYERNPICIMPHTHFNQYKSLNGERLAVSSKVDSCTFKHILEARAVLLEVGICIDRERSQH